MTDQEKITKEDIRWIAARAIEAPSGSIYFPGYVMKKYRKITNQEMERASIIRTQMINLIGKEGFV